MLFLLLFSNRRTCPEMKSVTFMLIILTVCAVKQICAFMIDTMDTNKDRIDLKDPSWPYSSSGILKSHAGMHYTANRNKTLILSAPKGYSLFAAVRLLDLRPRAQDSLTLFANSTTGPKTFLNSHSYQNKEFDPNENLKTFYAPDGQLAVNFLTGSIPETYGYDGFELMYTVQANWTKCAFRDFRCSNGRCVAIEFKCDGHNHCGDRSEQRNCFYPDPIRPRRGSVAGIVAGVILLLIAVVCVIYMMVRRAKLRKTQTRTVVNQYPPPENIQGYPPPYPEPGMVYPPPPPPYTPYQGITNPAYK